jgi:hypothetical protein
MLLFCEGGGESKRTQELAVLREEHPSAIRRMLHPLRSPPARLPRSSCRSSICPINAATNDVSRGERRPERRARTLRDEDVSVVGVVAVRVLFPAGQAREGHCAVGKTDACRKGRGEKGQGEGKEKDKKGEGE